MEFKIKKLIKDVHPPVTSSLPGLVHAVKYSFIETVGSVTSSVDFHQTLSWNGWDSSSFVDYNSLTEQQVKGWVTSSYESKKTTHMTSDNVTHPTGSWNNFITSVSSSLRNMIDVDDDLPW